MRSGAKRRPSDGSTPPSLETTRKRTKNTEAKPEKATASGTLRPSYREVITYFKMAIVPKEFPKEKFMEVQIEKLQEVVVEAFEILEDGNHPQFTGAYEERGAFILSCANQQTKLWVETIAPKLSPWEYPEERSYSDHQFP